MVRILSKSKCFMTSPPSSLCQEVFVPSFKEFAFSKGITKRVYENIKLIRGSINYSLTTPLLTFSNNSL